MVLLLVMSLCNTVYPSAYSEVFLGICEKSELLGGSGIQRRRFAGVAGHRIPPRTCVSKVFFLSPRWLEPDFQIYGLRVR
jgi:hypothetical protein